MKQVVSTLVLFFLLLFAYIKLAGPIPFRVTSTTTTKTDMFTVTGEGKAIVMPDIATVNVGVQANGATVKIVQQDLNQRINQVSDAIKKLAVDAKDIQTTNYSIYPTYDYQESGQRITGYQASTNLTIKVRDIDKANDVIDAATASGANQVGGVTFDVDDKTKAESEARQKAVDEAKKKAQQAAQIAGFRLGKIVNYNESFGGPIGPIPLYAKAEGIGGERPPTQIEPGSSEVIIQVSLSFEIL